MTNAKVVQTLLPTGYMPTPNEGEINPQIHTLFQQAIGSLLYIMLGTCPDIAFAVTKLAQFAANPSKEHLDKAKYILCYLVGIAKYTLVYKGASSKGLIAYAGPP